MSSNVVPVKQVDRIQWYEDHIAPFTTNAVAIGTSAAAVTDLDTKTAACRAAYDAQQVAMQAAKAATLTLRVAYSAMSTAGASILKQIRAKGELSGDSIYALAQIPAPAVPSPMPPPGQPFQFKAILNPDGSLKLAWRCNNPTGSSGTMYQVLRKIGSGNFVSIGGSGGKSFDDLTLPSAVSQVTYQITAVRSTASGTPAQFIVNFGVGGSGEMTATVMEAPKLAA